MNARKMKTGIAGITLIALVITIIVLLILAAVSIATLTGDNGLLTKASEAKIMTALGAVKEEIELDRTANLIDNKNVTVEQLLADGKIKRTVQAEGENYYMYYAIKPDAYQGMQGLGKGNAATLKDVFLIDDEFHVKYIDKSGKEYGDSINNKILEDETEIRFASKAFSEYVSRISGVTEEEMKFKWMKNQTSLTINDSSITSLEDLVFFPNLTDISLSGLKLENLQGIENCIKLKTFSTLYSTINSIEGIGECKEITTIKVSYGGTTKDFSDISNCSNLETFVYVNGEVNFEVLIENLKNISSLRVVNISNHGKIKSMESIKKLNSNIEEIVLNGNEIEKIEGLENFSNLKALGLR